MNPPCFELRLEFIRSRNRVLDSQSKENNSHQYERELPKRIVQNQIAFESKIAATLTESPLDCALVVEGIGLPDHESICWMELAKSGKESVLTRFSTKGYSEPIQQKMINYTNIPNFVEQQCEAVRQIGFFKMPQSFGPQIVFGERSANVWCKIQNQLHKVSFVFNVNKGRNVRALQRRICFLCNASSTYLIVSSWLCKLSGLRFRSDYSNPSSKPLRPGPNS